MQKLKNIQGFKEILKYYQKAESQVLDTALNKQLDKIGARIKEKYYFHKLFLKLLVILK